VHLELTNPRGSYLTTQREHQIAHRIFTLLVEHTAPHCLQEREHIFLDCNIKRLH
jgi:hypothetical protein